MADATLNFDVEDREGIRLIHVSGPLDSATYDQFKRYVDPMINGARVRIVLDCQNLTYVNSRGLTLLMHYQKNAKVAFSFFGVAALRPRIVKGIELLGLGKLMTFYPTLEEALQTAAAS
ncbi:MAG: STAS domain-containing protein [Kiritimatiellia bacterium]